MPVIEEYSDTSLDITDTIVRYSIKYKKLQIKTTTYDKAVFDYRKGYTDDNL